MITLKVELDKPKKNGTCPLYLRITEDRKHRRIALKVFIAKVHFNPKGNSDNSQWVRKTHPEFERLNDEIKKKYDEVSPAKKVLGGKAKRDSLAVALGGRGHDESAVTFIKFSEKELEKLQGNYNSYKGIRSFITRFQEFLLQHDTKQKDIAFEDITKDVLSAFEKYLVTHCGNNQNTAGKQLARLRELLNKAIREDLFPQEKNPFFKYKIPQRTEVSKIRLTDEEMKTLHVVELPKNSLLRNVRNAYLFSFYTAGMRCGDVLQMRWKNIAGGRLDYRMGKTGKQINIQLSAQVLEIISEYRTKDQSPEDFIFPFFDNRKDYSDSWFLKREISAKNALLNKYLKTVSAKAGVGKPISMHTARHTFADLGRRKTKDVYAISKALGHSKIQVTQQYLNAFDTETVDNALDTIFS